LTFGRRKRENCPVRWALVVSLLGLALIVQAAAGSGGSARTSVCPSAPTVLDGVYHSKRLTVRASCKTGAGTVVHVKQESGSGGDGDLHIQLKLDPAYVSLRNAKNVSLQGGNLVVEYMPRDGGHLPKPAVGEHLVLKGAWVLDTQHGWQELHPVWSVTVNGQTYRSGPQNGGSPDSDKSSNSRTDCRDHGHACAGY
jgi:hypothetical protein